MDIAKGGAYTKIIGVTWVDRYSNFSFISDQLNEMYQRYKCLVFSILSFAIFVMSVYNINKYLSAIKDFKAFMLIVYGLLSLGNGVKYLRKNLRQPKARS